MKVVPFGYTGGIFGFRDEHRFLSNFWPSPFYLDCKFPDGNIERLKFETNEHFYQAMKAKRLEDAKEILQTTKPGDAKRAGRGVEVRDDWEDIKGVVMFMGLLQKFSDPVLDRMLARTKGKYLEERNGWHDNYWGNCSCDRCREVVGRNQLGHFLMTIRDAIPYEKEAKLWN